MHFESVSEYDWDAIAAVLPKPWPQEACRVDCRMMRATPRRGRPVTTREFGARWGVSHSTACIYMKRAGWP